jgi:hypothetical protein
MSKKPSDILRSFHGPRKTRQPWGDAERTVRRRRIFKALKRKNIFKRLTSYSNFYFERKRKWLKRRQASHPTTEKCPVFIVGSNRSGTQMVCEAIGRSSHGWDYRESEFSIAFNSYYLRPDWLIKWLIRYSPAPIVSFGSILDAQFTDNLLSRFEGARAIWVYRRYQDAANSSARNWDHLNDLVGWVAHGEPERLGARGRRISSKTMQLFSELFHEGLSKEEGACLYWYMRNQLYFELDLQNDPRVLIVQYEDAVLNQEKGFRRIFNFLGFPYDPAIIDNVFASSVNKHQWTGIDSRIQEVCDALKARLDAHYAATCD